MRIEGVTTPAGVLPARKAWTVASAADGYWMVHVAWAIPGEPSWQPTWFSRVDADDLTAVAGDRRSRFVPWREVRSVRIRTSTHKASDPFPVARLRGVRPRKLEFRTVDEEMVRAFFEPIAARVS